MVCGRTAARADGGYQVDRYEPTPAGDPYAVVEAPWYAGERTFAAGVTFDYAHDLVAAQHRDPNGLVVPDPAPIAGASVAHVDGAVALLDRLAITASVPIVVAQQGTAFAGVSPSGAAIGDPRVGVRARVAGGGDGVALDASAYAWIPVGAEAHLAGDAKARGLVRATVSGAATSQLHWAVNASLLGRHTAVLSSTAVQAGNTVGSEVQLAAAARYLVNERLSVGPEALLAIGLADLPSSQKRASLEAFGTARYVVDDQLAIALGAGAGLAGTGVPDARVLVSLAYAPARPRGSRSERVIVLPDEEGHVGAVEVDDGKHKTLLDKAYASSEITRKAPEVKPVQGSPTALPPAVATVVKTLPPPDRDGDGIPDAADSCPERAGVANADPLRHGCPEAAEKIVVLPDEDGHVGGVEIDDGRGKTVLDHAYAAAEVGKDGHVEAVPASAAPEAAKRAVDRAVGAVASALPPPDADGDGIHDLDDACPDRAGVASPDPVRNGCPAGASERVIVVPDVDGHVGGVEIDDGKAKVVLDKAYASAEVAQDGKVAATASALPGTDARAIDRAVASLAKGLPILDADGDGIADDRDACPDRAGVASADPLRDGCPKSAEKIVLVPDADGHVGGIEVSDGANTVVLDAAYASAEVEGGKVALVPPATVAIALVRATTAIARQLPIADRDDDGIADADDACPARPGVPSASKLRNGCPRTVEQVVVLPDENGAVGAVEVDDGKTKVLLDKEYAAAEVGLDGASRALTAEASDVSGKYAEALAARPPGARIILYFTAYSTPARDLAGPIDNLAAEVKAKTTPYQIEVIGHTDQTGSEKLNIKIGQERAQLIADKLVAAGIPADRIKVTSMGSKEPAVKRASARVVELRNRRVEIWVR